MPLASRRFERETAGTILNQQMAPRSCVNPSESTAMTDAARAFRSFRFPVGRCPPAASRPPDLRPYRVRRDKFEVVAPVPPIRATRPAFLSADEALKLPDFALRSTFDL